MGGSGYSSTQQEFAATGGRLSPGSGPDAIHNWDACIDHRLSVGGVADLLCHELSAYDVSNRLAFSPLRMGNLKVRVSEPGKPAIIARVERFIDHPNGLVTHETMKVAQPWQRRRIGRTLVYNHAQLYLNLGYTRVFLVAAGEGGGYAWARAGFEAAPDAWGNLVAEVSLRIAGLKGSVADQHLDAARDLLTLGPREGLWSVADLPNIVAQRPLGSILLRGTRWNGSLELADEEAVGRLTDWMNSEATQ